MTVKFVQVDTQPPPVGGYILPSVDRRGYVIGGIPFFPSKK